MMSLYYLYFVVTFYSVCLFVFFFFFFKQKTAYEIGTGDWSSDVCSSDLMGWLPFSVHFELEEEGAKTAHCFARISFRFERRPIVIGHVFCLSLISQMDGKWRQQQLGDRKSVV